MIAVDLGYGWTKAMTAQHTFTQPSVVGPAEETIEGLGPEQGVRLQEGRQEYFIGHLAIKQCQFPWHNLGDNKPDDENTGRLLRAAVAAVCGHECGPVVIQCLVTGLPVNLWAAQKAAMEQLLSQLRHQYIAARIDGHTVNLWVTVKEVRVLAQPFGSLLDLVLDEQGHLVRRDMAAGRTLVIDVGFHTVDLLAAEGLEILSRLSHSTNHGLAVAYTALGRKLNKPIWEIDVLARQGRLTGLDTAYRNLAEQLRRTVESLNDRFDHYILTGGGGPLLHPYLHLPGPVEVPVDPHLANVRGYLKAGERLRRLATAS